MRVTYRNRGVREYWASRWNDIPADEPMGNIDVYPLKYAAQTVTGKEGKILEAGCGAGRILRYYHDRGYDIIGIDYIDIAIRKLKDVDQTLQAEVGDITNLRFDDESFMYILAFGLYHNLEHGLHEAIMETHRVLKKDGRICVSFRADNLQTRLTDYLMDRKAKKSSIPNTTPLFHKMNLTRDELEKLFINAGFSIGFVGPVVNMPILYKFAIFRSSAHKEFNENKARTEGYRLSRFGQWLQNTLMTLFPDQFCNIYVLIAHKE